MSDQLDLKQYIRDANNNPIGVMVAKFYKDNYCIGYSICHPNETYNKELGLKIAIGRMNCKRLLKPKRLDVLVHLSKFYEKCNRIFAKRKENLL